MTAYKEQLQAICSKNIAALKTVFSNDAIYDSLHMVAACIVTSLTQGGTVYLCGNGGSAADAQHIAGEFIGRYKMERRSFPAVALTTDTSVLTCIANDYSFEDIFKRQIEGLGKKGDVLIGISTSGNSKNVMRVVQCARAMGIHAISFTGGTGGSLKEISDINVNIDSDYTPFIQSGHGIALHALCEIVEKELAGILK